MTARAALALLLGGVLVVACGSPARRQRAEPKPRPKPPVLSTPQADQKAGREAAESVEAAVGLVSDPKLRAYEQAVGARLAREAPGFRYDYQFEIVDDWEPNAFALPGGFIYVSRGAHALTASEDELATVLAHEIAHVASRHAAARQQVAGNALMATLQWRSLAAYSRDLESAADRLGQGLAALLRPSILDDLGILATINWYCREYQKVYTEIPVEKEIGIDEDEIPDSLKIAIFRVMQEAMNNVAKHSKAGRLNLSLRKVNGAIELSVEDNGQGFDVPGALDQETGLGIYSMRERIRVSGGIFSIESLKGKGTSVRATWPI